MQLFMLIKCVEVVVEVGVLNPCNQGLLVRNPVLSVSVVMSSWVVSLPGRLRGSLASVSFPQGNSGYNLAYIISACKNDCM